MNININNHEKYNLFIFIKNLFLIYIIIILLLYLNNIIIIF